MQLYWDDRVVRQDDAVRLLITIPASFSSVIAWWRFRDLIRRWEDNPRDGPLAQLDPFWLTKVPERLAPNEIVISAFGDVLTHDAFRLRHALHEAAIAIDP